ncbi:MAG TPA: DUF4416 family protein [Candidatus Kryptonia bacterium]|nr:DUF4416 family protein [Candidatus Kryptonia bacterium]
MGDIKPPELVKLITGVLVAPPAGLNDVHTALSREFGAVDAASNPTPWTESTYYTAEMGAQLWRQYLSFATLIDPGSLPQLKRRTNGLEDRWRGDAGRRVNIDPGYLSATKLVLASTKDAAHRIFLGDGIYAEATLRYVDGAWQTYPYTYRDYADAAALAFFTEVRSRFLAQRRAAAAEI